MPKKYKLTKKFKLYYGIKLFQIEALISFSSIDKGEKGGWIEKEKNLDQDGDAWVSGNAWVYGNARVSGDAWVSGRFDLTCSIDFKLKRIAIDSKTKLNKLKKFLDDFDKEKKDVKHNRRTK